MCGRRWISTGPSSALNGRRCGAGRASRPKINWGKFQPWHWVQCELGSPRWLPWVKEGLGSLRTWASWPSTLPFPRNDVQNSAETILTLKNHVSIHLGFFGIKLRWKESIHTMNKFIFTKRYSWNFMYRDTWYTVFKNRVSTSTKAPCYSERLQTAG